IGSRSEIEVTYSDVVQSGTQFLIAYRQRVFGIDCIVDAGGKRCSGLRHTGGLTDCHGTQAAVEGSGENEARFIDAAPFDAEGEGCLVSFQWTAEIEPEHTYAVWRPGRLNQEWIARIQQSIVELGKCLAADRIGSRLRKDFDSRESRTVIL